MQTQQENGQLKRTMKTRHLIMLSLGGVIGTGLFFNTGYIISTTGAAGTLLAFGHWSTLGWLDRPDVLALDSGCVWGGQLSALKLGSGSSADPHELIQVSCVQAQKPGK